MRGPGVGTTPHLLSSHEHAGRSGRPRNGGTARDFGYPDPVATEISDRIRAFFAADPRGAAAVYLFGSQARGTAGASSDVDVGVLFATAPAATLAAQPFALEDDPAGLLGGRVQVVVLNAAPPDLIHRVLRDGDLLVERDRSARIRFEVAARNAYFDLKPFLDRYRRPAA